ncbi:MAG: hypothetical protein ACLSHC_09430 [Bilophila wadsworthia]
MAHNGTLFLDEISKSR